MLSKLFKKKHAPDFVISYEVWIVRWKRRTGCYASDRESTSKVFLSEQDAKAFAKKMEEAQALLQYTEDLEIEIEKQED